MADDCFWSQRRRPRGGQPLLLHHPRYSEPLPLQFKDFQEIRSRSALTAPSFFSFLEPDIKDYDVKTQLHVWRKIEYT